MAALARPDPAIAAELAAALADELPLFKRDGGFVRAGYDATLDETRALRDELRRVVAALQARYADETQVSRSKSGTTTCSAISSRSPPSTATS